MLAPSPILVAPPAPRRPRMQLERWVAAVLAVFFFALLGSRPLSNPDEGRYVEIPREMLATGDFVTPRLNGVKYFEKPPLVYWMTAAALTVFGRNEFAARFCCAAAAWLGAMLVFRSGRALFDELAGAIGAVVLATSLLYYGLSRVLLLDMVLTVSLSAALLSFLQGIRAAPGRGRRAWFAAFYAASAAAVMTKGLIGIVLPAGIIASWLVLTGVWRRLRPFHPVLGALIFSGIAAPWHILAARANPGFLHFYFVHEHFLRYTTQVHARTQPWWFFGPVFLAGLFPWVVFLFQAARERLAGGWAAREENAVGWFLTLWIAGVLLFFSASQSKLIPYILPAFPAAALLIGSYLGRVWQQARFDEARRGMVAYGLAVVLLASALVVARVSRDPVARAELWPWQWAAAGLLLSGAAVTLLLLRRKKIRPALMSMAGASAVFLVTLNPIAAVADRRSTKPLAEEINDRFEPGDQVYALRGYFQDLPVYLERTVSVVDFQGELAFGIGAEPEKAGERFLSVEQFLARWRSAGRHLAVAKRRDIEDLLARPDFPCRVVAEYRGRVLLQNHAY